MAVTSLVVTSCETTELPSLENVDDALAGVQRYGGGAISSDGRRALAAVRTITAIARYRATQEQVAQARRKAKPSDTETRQYIRVKPAKTSTASSTRGTHVVRYDPKKDKIDDEVLVVSETDLSRGDSVSINGQSGKII
jgi:hypothetical protein